MTHPLHAIVLNLVALESGTLVDTVGELAHAAFYAALEAADPALAAQLHEAQERAPFTLSPLYGFRHDPQARRVTIGEGQEGWLRVCLLDGRAATAFLRYLMQNAGPALRLGRVPFAVISALGAPGSHPWAGYTTVEALAALDEAREQWTLHFQSPTAIRWGEADDGTRRVELFPQPRMAIAGLRKRWDDLTGEGWGRAFEEWVERNVMVGRIWRWETERVSYRRQSYLGGVGTLEYRLLDGSDRGRAAHLNRLLHLAFYTGIGYKTTHGLGQVRVREDDKAKALSHELHELHESETR
jgi:CRISPR-associated endoribonuclease Cas6